MTTGAEILSYTGNAALGANASGNAIEATDPVNLDYLNQAIDRASRDDHQRNTLQYMQRIKDRDDTLAAMNNMQIDVPLDEEYRSPLENKINEARKLWLSNPNAVLTDPKKYLQMKDINRQFAEQMAMAKTNQIEIKKMEQDYANNTNPTYRAALAKHIQEQKALGTNKLVVPYPKKAGLNNWIYAEPQGTTVTKTKTDSEGDQETTVTNTDGTTSRVPKAKTVDNTGTFAGVVIGDATNGLQPGLAFNKYQTASNLPNIYDKYSPEKMTPTEYNDLQDQVNSGYEAITASPEFMNKQSFDNINAAIATANRNEGLKPGMRYYTPPITRKNPETGEEIFAATPTELAIALSVAKAYKKSGTEYRPSLEVQKQLTEQQKGNTEKAQQANYRASIGKTNAETKTINDTRAGEIEKLNSESYKNYAAGDKDKASARKEALISKPFTDLENQFDNIQKLKNWDSDFSIKNPVTGKAVSKKELFGDLGVPAGEENNFEIVKLSSAESTARNALAEGILSENGKYIVGKATQSYALRDKRDPLNSIRLFSLDGKTLKVKKNIDFTQGLNELAAYNANWDPKQSTETQNEMKGYWNYLQGEDAIKVDLAKIKANRGGGNAVQQTTAAPATTKATREVTPAPGAKPIVRDGKYYLNIGGEEKHVIGRTPSGGLIIED